MNPHRFETDNIVPMSHDEVAAPPIVFRLVETMMAFHPHDRYQTPAQLLEAVREARRQLGDPSRAARPQAPPEPTIFVIEKNARLRELLRHNLREMGFRVFIAGDPT